MPAKKSPTLGSALGRAVGKDLGVGKIVVPKTELVQLSPMHEARIDADARDFAKRCIPYILRSREMMKERRVVFDRNKLLVALEAVRRGYILAEVEAIPELGMELKSQVAYYTTGAAKSYSSLKTTIFGPQVEMLMALVLTAAESMVDVMDYFGIQEPAALAP